MAKNSNEENYFPSEETLITAHEVIRALKNPLRKEILDFLDKKKRANVTEIMIALRSNQSVISQQLGILKGSGIVIFERDGKYINYSVNYDKLTKIEQVFSELK